MQIHLTKNIKKETISAQLARLMALPNAPKLQANASDLQVAAYNGYWLGVMKRYRDVVRLQRWKGDDNWLPEY